MRNIICISGILLILLIPVTLVFAQSKPTPEVAKSFLDFYFNGQGQGIVLVDVTVCNNVEENECSDSVPLTSLEKGKRYYLWMSYLVPKGDKTDDIIIQFNQGGLTRITREVSVSGSIRYRTWKGFTLSRAGNWEVKILYDRRDMVETLETLSLAAVE